jgi:hypothetical protein
MVSLHETRQFALLGVLLLGVMSSSCKKKYTCTATGDVSKLADWKALGVIPIDDRTQVCVATEDRLELVYATPPLWPDVAKTIERNVEDKGWSNPALADVETYKLDENGWFSDFEKCKSSSIAGSTYLDCTEPLNVAIRVLPSDMYEDQPFLLSASYWKDVKHSYVDGKSR